MNTDLINHLTMRGLAPFDGKRLTMAKNLRAWALRHPHGADWQLELALQKPWKETDAAFEVTLSIVAWPQWGLPNDQADAAAKWFEPFDVSNTNDVVIDGVTLTATQFHEIFGCIDGRVFARRAHPAVLALREKKLLTSAVVGPEMSSPDRAARKI